MVTSVGEKESVGAASSLSTVTVSGEPIVMSPLSAPLVPRLNESVNGSAFRRIVSVT